MHRFVIDCDRMNLREKGRQSLLHTNRATLFSLADKFNEASAQATRDARNGEIPGASNNCRSSVEAGRGKTSRCLQNTLTVLERYLVGIFTE